MERLTRVVQSRVLSAQRFDVFRHRLILVRRAREVITKSTARSVVTTVNSAIKPRTRLSECSDLRLEFLASTDSRDVWTRCGEARKESGCVLAIIAAAL